MALTDKITAIADGFRRSRGITKKLSFDEMAVLAAEKTGGSGEDCSCNGEAIVHPPSASGGFVYMNPVESKVYVDVEPSVVEGKTSCFVRAIDGVTYGFGIISSGYYESQNKGVASSFAMCRVDISTDVETTVTLSCINYAEANYDFGIISELDTTLALDNTADTAGVFKSFKGESASTVVSLSMDIPIGDHFIYIKFRKDGSTDSNNDSLRFKLYLG